jgi:hypothetical protein
MSCRVQSESLFIMARVCEGKKEDRRLEEEPVGDSSGTHGGVTTSVTGFLRIS